MARRSAPSSSRGLSHGLSRDPSHDPTRSDSPTVSGVTRVRRTAASLRRSKNRVRIVPKPKLPKACRERRRRRVRSSPRASLRRRPSSRGLSRPSRHHRTRSARNRRPRKPRARQTVMLARPERRHAKHRPIPIATARANKGRSDRPASVRRYGVPFARDARANPWQLPRLDRARARNRCYPRSTGRAHHDARLAERTRGGV